MRSILLINKRLNAHSLLISICISMYLLFVLIFVQCFPISPSHPFFHSLLQTQHHPTMSSTTDNSVVVVSSSSSTLDQQTLAHSSSSFSASSSSSSLSSSTVSSSYSFSALPTVLQHYILLFLRPCDIIHIAQCNQFLFHCVDTKLF